MPRLKLPTRMVRAADRVPYWWTTYRTPALLAIGGIVLAFLVVRIALSLYGWTTSSQAQFVSGSLSVSGNLLTNELDAAFQLEPSEPMSLARFSGREGHGLILTSFDSLGSWRSDSAEFSGRGARGDLIVCPPPDVFDEADRPIWSISHTLFDHFLGENAEAFVDADLRVDAEDDMEFHIVGVDASLVDIKPSGQKLEKLNGGEPSLVWDEIVVLLTAREQDKPVVEVIPGPWPGSGLKTATVSSRSYLDAQFDRLLPISFGSLVSLETACRRFIFSLPLANAFYSGDASISDEDNSVSITIRFNQPVGEENPHFRLALSAKHIILKGVTGLLTVGNKELSFVLPSNVDIRGQDLRFSFDAEANSILVQGEASDAQVNDVQLLPPRFPWLGPFLIAVAAFIAGSFLLRIFGKVIRAGR